MSLRSLIHWSVKFVIHQCVLIVDLFECAVCLSISQFCLYMYLIIMFDFLSGCPICLASLILYIWLMYLFFWSFYLTVVFVIPHLCPIYNSTILYVLLIFLTLLFVNSFIFPIGLFFLFLYVSLLSIILSFCHIWPSCL